MNLVAEQCQKEKHHPEWTNVKRSCESYTGRWVVLTGSQVYRNVTIRWTTHVPRGMTMKDIRMAEYCDSAECAVQNSPKELERLRSRNEITTEEYKLLVELSTGKTSAADLPEAAVAELAHPEGPEEVKEVHMNSGGASTGNANESSEEKVASTGNSDAFRRRLEKMKRYYGPPIRLDTEGTLKP